MLAKLMSILLSENKLEDANRVVRGGFPKS